MDAKTFYSVAASGTTGVLSNYVYSATNVRLRELSLSYTLPALARERLRITLSLIANNVLMLHNEAPFDPELTSNTGTYYQGFDYFMPPSRAALIFSPLSFVTTPIASISASTYFTSAFSSLS